MTTPTPRTFLSLGPAGLALWEEVSIGGRSLLESHEDRRRRSVSFSDERTAIERGAVIDGDEMVWPDGARYPRGTDPTP
jgi:hypothetical protein